MSYVVAAVTIACLLLPLIAGSPIPGTLTTKCERDEFYSSTTNRCEDCSKVCWSEPPTIECKDKCPRTLTTKCKRDEFHSSTTNRCEDCSKVCWSEPPTRECKDKCPNYLSPPLTTKHIENELSEEMYSPTPYEVTSQLPGWVIVATILGLLLLIIVVPVVVTLVSFICRRRDRPHEQRSADGSEMLEKERLYPLTTNNIQQQNNSDKGNEVNPTETATNEVTVESNYDCYKDALVPTKCTAY